MQRKKIDMEKMRFFEEKKFICFSNVYYSEIRKKQALDAVRLVMVNEIKSSNLFYV